MGGELAVRDARGKMGRKRFCDPRLRAREIGRVLVGSGVGERYI
jgi:hypothetical protein